MLPIFIKINATTHVNLWDIRAVADLPGGLSRIDVAGGGQYRADVPAATILKRADEAARRAQES